MGKNLVIIKLIGKLKYDRVVRAWLKLGLIMLIGQVVIGGITRLTGSGLSITKWEIVVGTFPPLSHSEWLAEFELYQQTPQFQKINDDFRLNDFKFIYFWEYFHRLWVRILGFVFLIPFLIFIAKKRIDGWLVRRLLMVVLLAAITASAGWIMVKSGLIDRPWVNAYKLTLHFGLALLVISAMVKIIANVYNFGSPKKTSKNPLLFLLLLTAIQMISAGLMAGMKAGIFFPTWPSMNGVFVPKVLCESNYWTLENMANYDSHLFAPALVQFIHRNLAYLIVITTIWCFFFYRNKVGKRNLLWLSSLLPLVLIQGILGVFTVLYAQGHIPLFLGVAHQFIGLLYLICLLFFWFGIRKRHNFVN